MATDESMWMEKVIAVGSEWIWSLDGYGLMCFWSDRNGMDLDGYRWMGSFDVMWCRQGHWIYFIDISGILFGVFFVPDFVCHGN